MFAVVGCRECGTFWIVQDAPKTTGCPRCGTRHEYARLKKFVETDDADKAREARSRLIAEQSGYADAYADLGSFSELERQYDDPHPSEFVDAQSIDSPSRARRSSRSVPSTDQQISLDSARPIVLSAIRDLDRPTLASIIQYADAHGVTADQAREQLESLVETGNVRVENDRYSLP